MKVGVRLEGPASGEVVSQRPGWGVAAGPGMRVVLRVKGAAPNGRLTKREPARP